MIHVYIEIATSPPFPLVLLPLPAFELQVQHHILRSERVRSPYLLPPLYVAKTLSPPLSLPPSAPTFPDTCVYRDRNRPSSASTSPPFPLVLLPLSTRRSENPAKSPRLITSICMRSFDLLPPLPFTWRRPSHRLYLSPPPRLHSQIPPHPPV